MLAAVDLGGTSFRCALADGDGTFVAEASEPTRSHEGPEAVLGRIAECIASLSERSGERPAAIGMGIPGLVDRERGIARFLPNFPTRWRGVPVGEILGRLTGAEIRILNDVRMATLGELVFGLGRSARTMAFYALGTGVGGGIAIEGKLLLGPLGAAGEIGHHTIVPDGPVCGCGNRGCLETFASGPAIAAEGIRLLLSGLAPRLHEATGGDAARVSPKVMADAARAGDEAVASAIARVGTLLGIGIANVVTTIHPDLVVIGGGVAELGDLILEPARAEVATRVGMLPPETVRIEKSLLGERCGLAGGVALAGGKL
jgi:glucokinase